MNKKLRVIIGYLFVLVGILMPLIAFTSISYREISADGKYKIFQNEKPHMNPSIESYNEKVEKNEGNIIDPFQNEDYKAFYNIDGLKEDDIFAYIIIPKLDLKKPIYLDASFKHLKMGVAQVEGTSLPIGGKSTRSVIAGHRGGWGDLFFYNIDDLNPGDEIFIDSPLGLLKYAVSDKEIIGPGDWEKILPIKDQDMISLLTCHPKRPPRPKRLLVNAKRVYEEKTIEETKDQKESSVSNLKYGIYAITIIGWISLLIVFINMCKYIVRGKKPRRKKLK